MCIAYLALAAHADWPVFIAANRDEFHKRPTRPGGPWPDHPHIFSGIDLAAQGTWLGVTAQGRYALLTNYRDLSIPMMPQAPSRGELVSNFLMGADTPPTYAQDVASRAHQYNGFNLIVGDLTQAWYVGHQGKQSSNTGRLEPGRYVLSNHLLDTPWPKARRLRQALDHFPGPDLTSSFGDIFDILKDPTQAADETLPNTGLSLERERLLSSPFIVSADYGTRCSTIIAIHTSGKAWFSEVTYDPQGRAIERHDWPFDVQDQALQPAF